MENTEKSENSFFTDLQESCAIKFTRHVEEILAKLAFTNSHSMSKLNSYTAIEEVEKCVRQVLARKNFLDTLTNERKIELFGELWWTDPENFSFLPGEKHLLITAAEVCAKMSAKLLKTPPAVKRKQPSSDICNKTKRQRTVTNTADEVMNESRNEQNTDGSSDIAATPTRAPTVTMSGGFANF